MDEKVVLITGASAGIGAAVAAHFAHVGYRRFALVARREDELERAAEACRENGGDDVLVLPIDLSSEQGSIDAVKRTIEHFNSEYTYYVTYTVSRRQKISCTLCCM